MPVRDRFTSLEACTLKIRMQGILTALTAFGTDWMILRSVCEGRWISMETDAVGHLEDRGSETLLQTNSAFDLSLLVEKEERKGLFNNFCNASIFNVL